MLSRRTVHHLTLTTVAITEPHEDHAPRIIRLAGECHPWRSQRNHEDAMDRLGRSANPPASPHNMPANSYPTPGSSTPGRRNKIVDAMKRSFPPRPQRLAKNDVRRLFCQHGWNGLTIEQDARDSGYSYFHYEERAGRVPTVEQISMGLHLSRTPHLRSTNGRARSMSSEIPPAKPDAKPAHRSRATAPPPKPALKNISSPQTALTSTTPSFTNTSTSTSTTLSSAMLRTDRNNSFFTPHLFSRMTKMIPSSQSRPSREVEPEPRMTSRKKLVRFSVDETK